MQSNHNPQSIAIYVGVLLASFMLFSFATTAQAWNEQSSTQYSSVGELELQSDDGALQTPALLFNTKVSGHIEGLVVALTLEQVFKNPSDQWLHGRYVFPLPPTAAIDSLTIQIGDRVIQGRIQEKEQAKQTFAKAQREGKRAGLLEQYRPNLFSVAVANIPPHAEVTAKITFIDKVEHQDDVFSLRLPTTLTPRYVPDSIMPSGHPAHTGPSENAAGVEHVSAADYGGVDPTVSGVSAQQLHDIQDVTPPQTYDHAGQTDHSFTLDLSLNAGYSLEAVRSSSHRLAVRYPDDQSATIELANGSARLNADLILEWQTAIGQSPKAQLFTEQTADGYYSLLMLTPPQSDATLSLPKNVTFIIDSSGSMAGEPMRQAQQALLNGLQFLSPVDRFNVIDFDSEFRALFNTPQPAIRSNISAATALVNALDADGGTEMFGALDYALRHPGDGFDTDELRQIIFITDGAVYNERELFALINQHLGDARLFTVGIGSAPNTYFMQKAAQFGRGTATMISDLTQVSQRVTKLFQTISAPVLRDLSIDWGTEVEHFPSRLPDLYSGEPLSVVVYSKQPLANLKLYGRMLDSEWQSKLANTKRTPTTIEPTSRSVRLDSIWARHKIAELMDQLVYDDVAQETVQKQVTELGLKHQLLTKFTSFVAVEEVISRPENTPAKHEQVPNLMPSGSTMAIPQTATMADLLLWLGLLLMGIGLWLNRKGIKRATHV